MKSRVGPVHERVWMKAGEKAVTVHESNSDEPVARAPTGCRRSAILIILFGVMTVAIAVLAVTLWKSSRQLSPGDVYDDVVAEYAPCIGGLSGTPVPEHEIQAGGYRWYVGSYEGPLQAGRSYRGTLRIVSVGSPSQGPFPYDQFAEGWKAEFTSGSVRVEFSRMPITCD